MTIIAREHNRTLARTVTTRANVLRQRESQIIMSTINENDNQCLID